MPLKLFLLYVGFAYSEKLSVSLLEGRGFSIRGTVLSNDMSMSFVKCQMSEADNLTLEKFVF